MKVTLWTEAPWRVPWKFEANSRVEKYISESSTCITCYSDVGHSIWLSCLSSMLKLIRIRRYTELLDVYLISTQKQVLLKGLKGQNNGILLWLGSVPWVKSLDLERLMFSSFILLFIGLSKLSFVKSIGKCTFLYISALPRKYY